jgi:hypothetical protein
VAASERLNSGLRSCRQQSVPLVSVNLLLAQRPVDHAFGRRPRAPRLHPVCVGRSHKRGSIDRAQQPFGSPCVSIMRERRVSEGKKRLARLSRTTAVVDHVGNATDLRDRWPTLPLTRQHAIVEAVLDHVVVAPGRKGFNRFDPGRFEPVWRA